MKSPLLTLPEAGDLRALRVHEAVRDYPELLPILAPPGKAMEVGGALVLSEMMPRVQGGEAAVLSLLSWRGKGRG